jgi:hypothetical protein
MLLERDSNFLTYRNCVLKFWLLKKRQPFQPGILHVDQEEIK